MAVVFDKNKKHLITLPNGQYMGRNIQGGMLTAWVKVKDDPQIFTGVDIGTATTGSWSQDGEVHTIEGSGTDIWQASDGFRFVYLEASGDCTITARVTSLENTHAHAKASVMFRNSLAANSRYAHAVVKPVSPSFLAFDTRATDGATAVGGNASQATPLPGAPAWVRVTRVGNLFTGYYSLDGVTYTQMGTATTITMNSTVYVGLAVTSHADGTLCTAEFDQVEIDRAATNEIRHVATISAGDSFTKARMSLQMNANGYWQAVGRRTDAESVNFVTAPTKAEPGRIYFLAGRFGYSTGVLDLFIDGQLVASASIASWTGSSDDTEPMGAAVAARSDGAGNYFDGTIDDIRIYHRVLTDEDVMSLFVARGRDRNQPYVRWKLRESGSGITARREIRDSGEAQSDGATDTFIDTYPIYAEECIVAAYPPT